MRYLITGGCGFIGSHFGDFILTGQVDELVNVDKQTPISNTYLWNTYGDCGKYIEIAEDICRDEWMSWAPIPDIVVHFAAESHVDRSLSNIDEFVQSNINGTVNVAKYCLKHNIKMIFVSTDEVYGELKEDDLPFTEQSPINPRNPYAATKASAEFMLRSIKNANPKFKCVITRCSNNFGARQDSTKFIPVCINAIKNGRKIPLYGNGSQIRDWIHVKDHCIAIYKLTEILKDCDNIPMGVFNIGANNEHSNLNVVKEICRIMGVSPMDVIDFVPDPRGEAHDFRYAIDSTKAMEILKWKPVFTHPFVGALTDTINKEISCAE